MKAIDFDPAVHRPGEPCCGLKVVLGIAWTCVISAEMVGANSGLGFRIETAEAGRG